MDEGRGLGIVVLLPPEEFEFGGVLVDEKNEPGRMPDVVGVERVPDIKLDAQLRELWNLFDIQK